MNWFFNWFEIFLYIGVIIIFLWDCKIKKLEISCIWLVNDFIFVIGEYLFLRLKEDGV